MSVSSKQPRIDANWVFWRSFILVFLAQQILFWHWMNWLIPGRRHRLILLLLTLRSVSIATMAAGVITVLAVLIDILVIRPLSASWLRPSVDPSGGLFHLAAGETTLAGVPARRKSGWRWQPGTLTLTDRRLWFFPASWDEEPWSLGLPDLDRIDPERGAIARLAPIRNWPHLLRFSDRSGQGPTFATADPDAILAWFHPPVLRGEYRVSPNRGGRQGVFDA